MCRIELTTIIDAPIQRCFDLSRSIELHRLSTKGTQEEAIAGVTTGLIGDGEEVTWRAKHFGITQTLTSKITRFEPPYLFRDEMVKGAFKSFVHDHIFETVEGRTIMHDHFEFATPGGVFGKIFNMLILKKYMYRFLLERNTMIKNAAESDQWQRIPGMKY